MSGIDWRCWLAGVVGAIASLAFVLWQGGII